MNCFAGIISYYPDTQPEAYLQKLLQQFPSRLSNTNKVNASSLSASGHFQVSVIEDADSTLFFDGELFNAAEVAASAGIRNENNIATLVHSLFLKKGIEAAAAFNGQYLIIYKTGNRVFLLNDHAGIQQVFYYCHRDFFLFASDIKFLLAHPQCPCTINWESALRRPQPSTVLSTYQSYQTWFKDIYLLPEASSCSIDPAAGALQLSRYWNGLHQYSDTYKTDKRSANEVIAEYMWLLEDAVKIRIRQDDKAVSFLSGGLDSSVICALAAKHKALDTYSIITQVTCLEGTTPLCDSLAKQLHFNNTQVLVPFHELCFDKTLWKQRVWNAESPVNHTDSLTKTFLQYAIRQQDPRAYGVLTGTGSDQYNGGLVRWMLKDEDSTEQGAARFLKAVKEHELQQMLASEETHLRDMQGLLHPGFISEISGRKKEDNYWMHYVKSCLHINTYTLLWDEVRASSYSGHSTRFPFLDHRFAAFFAGIPEHLHRELFYDKQILRIPAKELLPADVINKQKQPADHPRYDFRIRLFEWLCSGEDSLLQQAFGDENSQHPVIDVAALYRNVKKGEGVLHWNNIMQLINLALLEKMPGQTEQDLDYFSRIPVPEPVSFADPAATKIWLDKRLSILSSADMLQQPLSFATGCSLVQHIGKDTIYIARKHSLAYEIDEEYADWKRFLLLIGNGRSAQDILQESGIGFAAIEEFFMICVREGIFLLQENQPAA